MDGHGVHHGHHGDHGGGHHAVAASVLNEEDNLKEFEDLIANANDHSGHQQHVSESAIHTMMMMYFHGGYDEVILFDFWVINSIGGLIGSMFACFVLGIAHEGLKFFREHLMRGNFKRISYNRLPRIESGGSRNPSVTADSSVTDAGDGSIRTVPDSPRRHVASDNEPAIKIIETSMLSFGHIALTALHFLQLTIAYFLMLIVMTFNSWLALAVVLGSTTGYFLFGWRKSVVVDVAGGSDHCH